MPHPYRKGVGLKRVKDVTAAPLFSALFYTGVGQRTE